jgi:hypothetical protein
LTEEENIIIDIQNSPLNPPSRGTLKEVLTKNICTFLKPSLEGRVWEGLLDKIKKN